MAVIELVTEAYEPKAAKPAKKTTTKKAAAPKAEEKPADEAPVEETEVVADPVEASAEAVDLEPATEVEGVDEDVFEETEGGVSGKYAGSHVPLEDESKAPEGFPIKGNEDSMKFHEPDGQWYEQTVAEVWFDSVESAEAAGFTRAGE
jgi:large subunit ribosomal protein L17